MSPTMRTGVTPFWYWPRSFEIAISGSTLVPCFSSSSFPSSAWERTFEKLCFACRSASDREFFRREGRRSGASRRCGPKQSLGPMLDSITSYTVPQPPDASRATTPDDRRDIALPIWCYRCATFGPFARARRPVPPLTDLRATAKERDLGWIGFAEAQTRRMPLIAWSCS